MFDKSKEFEYIVEAYEKSGGDGSVFKNELYGTMIVSGNKILSYNNIPGLQIEGRELPDGAEAHIRVKANTRLERPVHLCFGVIPEHGIQEIIARFYIEENASAKFIAHCSFPNAVKVKHIMDGKITLEKNASMVYTETHFHGENGGVEVLPDVEIHQAEGSYYLSEFKLVKGSVGRLDLKYRSVLEAEASCELYAKVYGKRQDRIEIQESIYLNGENSSGLAKSRIVVSEQAYSNVLGEIVGKGSHSRGHVDCLEIIRGSEAVACAVPRLMVEDDTAKLTHEAAIGSLDKKQLETLMARGLPEDEAIDILVQGILK